MQLVEPKVEFITDFFFEIKPHLIVDAASVCYKADKLKEMSVDNYGKFIANLIKNGHESPLEHVSFTVKFITDRGISHELVRHRLAAFTQESTRYCNYSKEKFSKEIYCVMPDYSKENLKWTPEMEAEFREAFEDCQRHYMNLIDMGATPQFARAVLPTGLKTELVMTANIREWRHILKLRCDQAAHPDVRYLCNQIYNELYRWHPYFVCDMNPYSSEEERDKAIIDTAYCPVCCGGTHEYVDKNKLVVLLPENKDKEFLSISAWHPRCNFFVRTGTDDSAKLQDKAEKEGFTKNGFSILE